MSKLRIMLAALPGAGFRFLAIGQRLHPSNGRGGGNGQQISTETKQHG